MCQLIQQLNCESVPLLRRRSRDEIQERDGETRDVRTGARENTTTICKNNREAPWPMHTTKTSRRRTQHTLTWLASALLLARVLSVVCVCHLLPQAFPLDGEPHDMPILRKTKFKNAPFLVSTCRT